MKALIVSGAAALLMGLGTGHGLRLPGYMSEGVMRFQPEASGGLDPALARYRAKMAAEGIAIGPSTLYVEAYMPKAEPITTVAYDYEAEIEASNQALRRDLARLDEEIAANRAQAAWRPRTYVRDPLTFDVSVRVPASSASTDEAEPAEPEAAPIAAVDQSDENLG